MVVEWIKRMNKCYEMTEECEKMTVQRWNVPEYTSSPLNA